MRMPTKQQPILPGFGAEVDSSLEQRLSEAYSNDGKTSASARLALELRYAPFIRTTNEIDRRLVSYQASKNAQLHGWIKYKEGFSSQLVRKLIEQFDLAPGDSVLEPFAGSGTTLLVSKDLGLDAVGIELLPICHLIWRAKSLFYQYDSNEIHRVAEMVRVTPPGLSDTPFPHIKITESAFPRQQERRLMWYRDWFSNMDVGDDTKVLLELVLTSILEDISYTRKDGQYLRWDARSAKVRSRQRRRKQQGKKPLKPFNKGVVLSVKDAINKALSRVMFDLDHRRASKAQGRQELIEGSVLQVFPQLEAESFDAVITSPPYCNRYDYTRTYALELAFLGIGEQGIRKLRQELLSSTVENKLKTEKMLQLYSDLGREADFRDLTRLLDGHLPFQEVLNALQIRAENGELNNKGVLRMVEGYFTELALVVFELHRVCKPGAHVAIVNDNVRYGGEIIPVDLLTTDFAHQIGFAPEAILALPQRKGNSSQQMGKYGREANRKSITIWRKE